MSTPVETPVPTLMQERSPSANDVNALIAAGHCPKALTRGIFKDHAIGYKADGTAYLTTKRPLKVKSSK